MEVFHFGFYNFKNDFVSFELFTSAKSGLFSKQFAAFFETSIPIILGARKFWTYSDNFLNAANLTYFIYGFALVGFLLYRAVSWREYSKKLFSFDILLLSFFASIVYIFAGSSFGHLSEAPRYLLPLYVFVFPVLGVVLAGVYEVRKSAAVFLIVIIAGINLTSCSFPQRQQMGEPFVFANDRVSESHTGLVSWLDENKISLVKTNYWIGYRLAYETKEKVKFLVYGEPMTVRIKSYEDSIDDHTDLVPYVLVPAQAKLVRLGLELQGYQYKIEEKSDYVIIYDLVAPMKDLRLIPNENYKIFTTSNQEQVDNINDQLIGTRWGSGQPQNNQMSVRFVFNQPQELCAFHYSLGSWIHDYPRVLVVSIIDESGKKHKLLKRNQYDALRFVMKNKQDLYFSVP